MDDPLLRVLSDALTLGAALTPVQRAQVDAQLGRQREAVKVFLAGLSNRTIRDLVTVLRMQDTLLTRLTNENIVQTMTPIELVEATKVVSALRNDLTTYLAEGDQRDLFSVLLGTLRPESRAPGDTMAVDTLEPAQRERIRAVAAKVLAKADRPEAETGTRSRARLAVRVVVRQSTPILSLVAAVRDAGVPAVCALRVCVREDIVIPDAF